MTLPPMPPLPVLTKLFEEMPVGVVLLDRDGKVVHYNRYEEQLAGRKRAQVLGRDFFHEVAPCLNVKELAGVFRRDIGKASLDVVLDVSFPFPALAQPRDVSLRMSSFEVDAQCYGLLMVEDVSAKRAIDRMKETLSSLIVHDLKNPLAVSLTHLLLLRSFDSVQSDPDALEMVDSAVRASNRLQRMIVNLLDVTRLETQGFPLRRVPLDVRGVAHETAEEMRALGLLRGVSIVVDAPEEPVVAFVDEDVLRRTLDNLVENAVRYAKQGGRVIVRCTSELARTVIEVVDDGPGIPDDMRERIFDKYAQLDDAAYARRRINRGLGLSFVQLAMRAHGGTVGVTCPPSGGSIFRVEVPREPLEVTPLAVVRG